MEAEINRMQDVQIFNRKGELLISSIKKDYKSKNIESGGGI